MKLLFSIAELKKGGLERVVLTLAKHFDADIVTNNFIPENTFPEFKNLNIVELKQANKFLFGMELMKTKFRDYDLYHSFSYFITNFGAIRNKPALWFCCVPKRDIYDMKEYYLSKVPFFLRPFSLSYLEILKSLDKYIVNNHLSYVTCISSEVQKIFNGIYGWRPPVVHPSVINLKIYKFKNFGDFYFLPSRYSKEKRVELAVKAFNKMRDKKLVVAGYVGDNQNYYEYLRKMAGPNIKLLTNLTDEEMKELYSTCRAVINIGMKDFFTITIGEAYASGKPVIADVSQWEQVDEKTGVLIKPDVKNLALAVREMTGEKASSMKGSCLKKAEMFSETTLIKKMGEIYKKICDLGPAKAREIL